MFADLHGTGAGHSAVSDSSQLQGASPAQTSIPTSV